MSGSACLDTSVVIRCLRGDPSLIGRVYSLPTPFVSGVALGELYYGAVLSPRSEAEIRRIDAFIANCELVFPDKLTSAVYADVKVALRRAGTPIRRMTSGSPRSAFSTTGSWLFATNISPLCPVSAACLGDLP